MQAKRRLVFEETRPVQVRVDRLDLEWLRRQFAEPFDGAAQAVQRAGLDQDDTVVERILVCDFGGQDPPVSVPAAWLSDRARLQQALLEHCRKSGRDGAALEDITIIGLRVEAWHEEMP